MAVVEDFVLSARTTAFARLQAFHQLRIDNATNSFGEQPASWLRFERSLKASAIVALPLGGLNLVLIDCVDCARMQGRSDVQQPLSLFQSL